MRSVGQRSSGRLSTRFGTGVADALAIGGFLAVDRGRRGHRGRGRVPPAPADGLAAARGRDARAVRRARQPRRGGRARHARARRRAAALPRRLGVAHLGFGLGGLRLLSAAFALASLPLLARSARRLAGRREALVATALFAGSWSSSSTGSTGGCTACFSSRPRVAARVAPRARAQRTVARGGSGSCARPRRRSPPIRTALSCSAGTGSTSLVARRDRLARGGRRRSARSSCSGPRSGSPISCSPAASTSASGAAASKLGGPQAVADYLWRRRGRRHGRLVAGDAARGRALRASGLVARRHGRPAGWRLTFVAVPAAAFLLARIGGSAAPESRHLIFLLPLFSRARRRGSRANGEARPARGRLRRRLAARRRRSRGPGTGRRRSSSGSPTSVRWRAPRPRPGSRSTSRAGRLLFGYEPLFLGAWERNSDFPRTVLPRADGDLALRVLERAGRRSDAASGSSTRATRTTSGRVSRSNGGTRCRWRSRCARSARSSCSARIEPTLTPEAYLLQAARAPGGGSDRSGSATPT